MANNNNDVLDLCQRYNQIKQIHQQRSWLAHSSFPDALVRLAEIYVRHRAHLHFAIALLHRHREIRPGYAMVHSRNDKAEDCCNMELLVARPVFPRAYHYCLDRATMFAPYEFSSTPVPIPDDAFLQEIATCIQQHNLCGTIAISHMIDANQVWLERLSADGEGTIAALKEKEQSVSEDDYITTEWAVHQGKDGINLVGITRCETKHSGHVEVDLAAPFAFQR